jgi:hypothetical protein
VAGANRSTRLDPPTRGLTDFPEHSPGEKGWSTQALNVEFWTGGVSTRRGSEEIRRNFYTRLLTPQPVVVKLVKSFSDPDRELAAGADMMLVGFVPVAGAEANSEQFRLVDINTGGSFVNGRPHNVAPGLVNTDPSSRWDACVFWPTSYSRPIMVFCTDHTDVAEATVNYVGRAPLGSTGVIGVDRVLHPFHNGLPNADDPGEYATSPIRARYCRQHRGRLVLGHLIGNADPDLPDSQPSCLWASNLGDIDGWPLSGVHQPHSGGDVGSITGLAEWTGNIAVFRRSSVSLFRLDGSSGPVVQVYRQIVNNRGCVAHGTIIDDVRGMTCFLASDGFYGFNGSPELVHLSAPIQRTLQRALDSDDPTGAHAVHYPTHRQVWLSVPSGCGGPDRCFVMDYSQSPPAWSEFEWQDPAVAWADGNQRRRLGGFATSRDETRLYGIIHQNTGVIDHCRFDVGDATDAQLGAAPRGFRSTWESGPISYGKSSFNRWRYLRPLIRPQGNHNASMWWRRDGVAFSSLNLNNQSQDVSMAAQGGGNALGAFVLGTDAIGAAEDHTLRVDVSHNGDGRFGRVGIRTNGVTATRKFDLRTLEIDVRDRGVRR